MMHDGIKMTIMATPESDVIAKIRTPRAVGEHLT